MPANSRDCRPKSRCACSAARSPRAGDEGPVELGKLEALYAALAAAAKAARARFRRTLAGRLVTLGRRPADGRAGAGRGRAQTP